MTTRIPISVKPILIPVIAPRIAPARARPPAQWRPFHLRVWPWPTVMAVGVVCRCVHWVSLRSGRGVWSAPSCWRSWRRANRKLWKSTPDLALSPRLPQLLALLQPLLPRLRLLAVSAGGPLAQLIPYLWQLHGLVVKQPVPHLWQLDGRPMSGDLGRGTAHAAVALALGVSRHGPPGLVQVAGGVNRHTQTLLDRHGLSGHGEKPPAVAGMAFGGAARQLLSPWLTAAQAQGKPLHQHPDLADVAVGEAQALLNLPAGWARPDLS